MVTNDFPPRVGGIQRTLEALWRELPADRVAVFCPAFHGWEEYDAGAPFTIFRQPERHLFPTPGMAKRVEAAARDVGADVIMFGATYPLAALGPRLATRGLPYLTAAHGFEYWISIAPAVHRLIRYATSRAARVPVLCSEFVARSVRAAVPPSVPVSVLYPGADVERFRPELPVDDLRARLGIGDRPTVVCVSRLVRRKGQDTLIRGMGRVRKVVPDAALVIVGAGPDEGRIRALAADTPSGTVHFVGEVAEQDLPRYYALADVFAMPCRTRMAGLEVEGWGNVFIEAAACGKPVVVGDSGGASETVIDGETGLLVDGTDTEEVAAAIATLLSDPGLARKMGEAGRERVLRRHSWPSIAQRLSVWLDEAAGGA